MKRSLIFSLALTVMIVIAGCKKNSPEGVTRSPIGSNGSTGATGTTGPKVIKTKVDPGVYLVGYKAMGDEPIDRRATFWKDNNPYQLSSIASNAYGICVKDTSIYVAGFEMATQTASNAVYWVNNQAVPLTFNTTGNSAVALAIGFAGNDLYVAGNVNDPQPHPVYWKNRSMEVLPGNGAFVTGMAIKGNDVYICGYYIATTPASHLAACYWKNGELYGTTDNVAEAKANAIAVTDNGDVYLSGYVNGTAVPRRSGASRPAFWKNNVLTVLPVDKPYAVANGVSVDGNDLYVSGSGNDGEGRGRVLISPKGVLWKNGTPEFLANSLEGGSLFTIQGDVYVTGLRPINSTTSYGIVIKNGDITAQGSLTSFNNILVVK